MLEIDDLVALQKVVEPPAVTVLCSAGPDGPARLERLLGEADRRLRLELDAAAASARIDALRVLAETVADDRGQRAIALFASATHRAASRLPDPVEDRVVVDDTFATRDLVRALHRSPTYLVVLLGEPGARLFSGRGRVVREIADDWFPVIEDPPPPGERGQRHDPGRQAEERRRRLVRTIDRGLDRPLAQGDGPVFVAGPEARVAAFLGGSRHRTRVEGDVRRTLASTVGLAELSRMVWPLVEAWLDRRQAADLAAVAASAGARRLAAGIDEVFPLAREGRGDLLVVEEGFSLPVLIDGDRLDREVDGTAPGVVDDVVDEVIEAVMTRGGRVGIVADGTLAERGRIALKLRY